MLIACPCCGVGVSDKADHCPRCGHPIGAEKNRRNMMIAFWLFLVAWVLYLLRPQFGP